MHQFDYKTHASYVCIYMVQL